VGDPIPVRQADRTQLQQIIAGLTEGVIVVETDRSITWANPTALVLHGVKKLVGSGGSADGDCSRFALCYRDHRPIEIGKAACMLFTFADASLASCRTVSSASRRRPSFWRPSRRSCTTLRDSDKNSLRSWPP